jgi:hypothetical protein
MWAQVSDVNPDSARRLGFTDFLFEVGGAIGEDRAAV